MTITKTEKPRLDLSALEWRLVLVAVLAIAYVVAWFGLETRPVRTAVRDAPLDVAPRSSPVWLDALPPAERPSFAVPPGWTVTTAPATATPRPVVRAPGPPPRRIRTRSS